jgi:hypothetical protein
MSHSNRGLNEPFYKWIDDVRRAMRKEKELQEKLEFYNMKLIGYKGVSYDRTGSSGSRSSGDSELLYWLDKIDQVEKQLTKNLMTLSNYKLFSNSLPVDLKNLLDVKLNNNKLFNIKKWSKSYEYQLINRIVQRWINFSI